MAVASALNVVRQIQALAEGPRSTEMLECLGQITSALLFFLDHPDSRVRLGSARTLVKLNQGYHEEVHKLDLARARSALSRLEAALAEGTAEDPDSQELRELLEELLAKVVAPPAAAKAEAAVAGARSAAPADGGAAGHDGRGEVVLRAGEGTDGKVKAGILESVVALPGVVSVTFEGDLIIVNTRTPALANDASFLADLFVSVKEQGIQGVSLVSAASAHAGAQPAGGAGGADAAADEPGTGANDCDDLDDTEPAYLDDDEDEDDLPGAGGSAPAWGGAGGLGAAGIGGAMGRPMGGMGGGGVPLQGGPQWSFFAQSNWMTGRRLQEFGDDPTIAARLAAAKRREEEKNKEQKSRLGALSSWLTGR